jgi:hypothetical protein
MGVRALDGEDRSARGVRFAREENAEARRVDEGPPSGARDISGMRPETQDLSRFVEGLDPERRTQFKRAVAEILARGGAGNLAAVQRLVTTFGTGEHLLPALTALSAWLTGAASRLGPDESARLAGSAVGVILQLRARATGRAGLKLALQLLPEVAARLERAEPGLEPDRRTELLRAAADLIARAMPARGFDEEIAKELREPLAKALESKRGEEACEAAVAGLHRARRPAIEEQIARLRERPQIPAKGHEEGSEREFKVHRYLMAVLEHLVLANPLAPAPLLDAVETLRAYASHTLLEENREDVPGLFVAAAMLLERFTESPIAQEVLDRLNELLPKAVTRDKADHDRALKALLSTAKAEDLYGVAEGLIAFKLALKNTNNTDYEALEKAMPRLQALPPETAVQVALAVTMHLNLASVSARLLRATIEVAADPHREQPWESLNEYVERFTSAAVGLKDVLQPPTLGVIATHLTDATTGKEVENVAQIGRVLQRLTNLLPQLDPVELVTSPRRAASDVLFLDLFKPSSEKRPSPSELLIKILKRIEPNEDQVFVADAAAEKELAHLAIAAGLRLAQYREDPLPLLKRLDGAVPEARSENAVSIRAQREPVLEGLLAEIASKSKALKKRRPPPEEQPGGGVRHRLEEGQKEHLEMVADKLGISESAVLRRFITAGLAEHPVTEEGREAWRAKKAAAARKQDED